MRCVVGRSILLFDNNGNPTETLRILLKLLEIQHDGTVSSIREATQLAWYENGKFKPEVSKKYSHLRERIIPLLGLLGFIEARLAANVNYNFALILRATLPVVRKRLSFLITEWQRGVRFDSIVLLGTERALVPAKEGAAELLNAANLELPFDQPVSGELPANEGEMMELVYRQAAPNFPWEYTPRQLVIAPKIGGLDPTTEDSVRYWIEKFQVKGGVCLVVSSQPFIDLQGLMTCRALPKSFASDIVGPASSLALPTEVFLDCLAKVVIEVSKERVA